MSDLIERQAAIDALDCINGVEEVLRSLPSAQPERTRGYWEYMPGLAASHNTIWWYTCSACGGKAINGGILTDFCPNCGADMRGEELDALN